MAVSFHFGKILDKLDSDDFGIAPDTERLSHRDVRPVTTDREKCAPKSKEEEEEKEGWRK